MNNSDSIIIARTAEEIRSLILDGLIATAMSAQKVRHTADNVSCHFEQECQEAESQQATQVNGPAGGVTF